MFNCDICGQNDCDCGEEYCDECWNTHECCQCEGEVVLKIKQYFCKHDYKVIAKHQSTQSNLWKCEKCGVYYIQHVGIGIGYECREPNIGGWVK